MIPLTIPDKGVRISSGRDKYIVIVGIRITNAIETQYIIINLSINSSTLSKILLNVE